MNNESEWWVWDDQHYTTITPVSQVGVVYLFNKKKKMFFSNRHRNGVLKINWAREITHEEYQPISEGEAILIMLQNGFKDHG